MSNAMQSAIISLVAETHIHAGTGQSVGALDLPVARERASRFPFIPGSGVKGAFRVWAEEKAKLSDKISDLFGPKREADIEEGLFAGHLLCSDARLVLLPVRCLSDCYKWVTCPTLLNRFYRDCRRVDPSHSQLPQISISEGTYLGSGENNGWLGLEEREFRKLDMAPPDILEALEQFVGLDLKHFVSDRLVILSDKDFNWFANYALPVMTRNALNDDKIVDGGALWHEESLAPDTIMYVLLSERKSGSVAAITDSFAEAPFIQMGGNETIGQGWFKMACDLSHKTGLGEGNG